VNLSRNVDDTVAFAEPGPFPLAIADLHNHFSDPHVVLVGA
jgi:hypothetical protein